MPYISNSDHDQKEMLRTLGVSSFDELVSSIPSEHRNKEDWKKHPGKSELSTLRYFQELAAKNVHGYTCFLGGGAYDHYIPSAISHITGRSEFSTAYTPYQPEVSQGTLQAIYEYQTMICELTGMEVSNASMYCGVSATAEAVLLASTFLKRQKILIAQNLPGNYKQVIATYCHGRNIAIEEISCGGGIIDSEDLKQKMNEQCAGLVLQYPNYFGIIEPLCDLSQIVHEAGGLVITSVNPIVLALLRTPGECAVDIVTGEGQVLGNSVNWGGPYLGIFAVNQNLIRKIPGRLSGRTVDLKGCQGFVLALQTREQHIRREKATSNICTNQGLVMIRACMYMSLMGKEGMRETANQCTQKAHYLADNIAGIPGYSLKYDKPFFHEFVVSCPQPAQKICDELLEHDIFAGIPLDNMDDPNALLIAVTEKRTKNEMDNFLNKLKLFATAGNVERVVM